ncbi:MAG: sun protein [Solirubrobacterales bacterium]|nr:sun protein [Solirubrobacterales bacterium]
MSVTPARRTAYAVLRRVFEHDAYADRALTGEAKRADLDPRERSFAMQLAFGAVQRRGTLDHLIATFAQRPVERLDPPLRAALRLGLFQLAYLDGVAAHAAVTESVELVKPDAPHGAGLVNAVLRRGATEAAGLLAALDDTTPQGAALKHSVPTWLAELWFAERGADEARALLEAINRPAEAALRANTLLTTPAALIAGGVPARLGEEPPESLVLRGPWDVAGSAEWRDGAVFPQSRASQLVARTLAPEPGERVLDLCAAPGGKTTHLGALMENRGEILAVEVHEGRAKALERTSAQAGATIVGVEIADAAAFEADRPFDRVLVDPPCSGLGTLQSRPDLRWRVTPERIAKLAVLQREILAAGARALRPGGTLVYSVCTISKAESDGVLADAAGLGLELEDTRETLPYRDGTDGFHIARLRRVSG